MKLNRKFPLLLITVTLLVIVLIAIWNNGKRSKSNIGGLEKPSGESKQAATPPIGQSHQKSDPSYEAAVAEKQTQFQSFFNTPIEFFGKVIDESGRPVESAETFYIVSSASFAGSPTITGPSTDATGSFSITGKRGPTLSVWVKHAGFYNTESSRQRFTYAYPGPLTKSPPKLPTRDNPAVFVLQTKGIAEPLVHYKKSRWQIPLNSTVIINLRSGETGSSSGNEEVVFTLKSDGSKLPLNTFHPFNWSLTVSVPNGGAIERADALSFQAPPDKYQSEIFTEMEPSQLEDKWSSSIKKDYFLSFDSGVYGRIQIDISGLNGRCTIETFLNPKPDSHNLEFDTKSAVKSQ